MTAAAAYDLTPEIGVAGTVVSGWDDVAATLAQVTGPLVIDSYPGSVPIRDQLSMRIRPDLWIDTASLMRPQREILAATAGALTPDPVFGRLSTLSLDHLLDPAAVRRAREQVMACGGRAVVTGPGAGLVTGNATVLLDAPRWDIVRRQRAGLAGNLGLDNAGSDAGEIYRRAYFVDWRVADGHKRRIWDGIRWIMTVDDDGIPRLAARSALDDALRATARRPFRVVPFFDPAPWGGDWMQATCNTGHSLPNLGWCFDCVPEENSLRLRMAGGVMELPTLDLVHREPRALLGEAVLGRFGAEFPIRTDFLDTMGGGNLSLQVHPLTAYMRDHFGHAYTQDESYYVMTAAPGAEVHLGLRAGVQRQELEQRLRRAERGESLDHRALVNCLPARPHDHFLIPAGTLHGSGANTVVLEISATPYIFTFKLYDWQRPGLDGRPRPLHIDRGLENLQFDRDTAYARRELVNRIVPIATGDGWREESTGLHPTEFIETRRHWFTRSVGHISTGGVEVLNLVEGERALIESPDASFEPVELHYAETIVLPADAGDYRITPLGAGRHATIKAFVRAGG